MRQANQLDRLLGLLLTIFAFSLPQAGRTQVALTDEFEGKIEEIKPARLFHPVLDTASIWLTSAQETEIRRLISTIDDITIQDALQNVIILDLYFEGEYAEVINEANGYMAKYPEGDPVFRPHILFTLAEAQYYQGNYNEAKDIYRAIRDEEDRFRYSEVYPHARHGLAWSYMHLGRYQEATEEFYECGVTDKLIVSTLFGSGITKYNEGNYREAVDFLVYLYNAVRYRDEEDATLLLLPSAKEFAKELIPKTIYYTGLAYYRLNDLDSAIRYAKEASDDYSRDPIAPIATYQTGWWSFQNGEYGRAIEYFNKAVKVADALDVINQDEYSILLLRAQAFYNSGDLALAMSSYREIYQDDSVSSGQKIDAIAGLDVCYAYIADSSFRDPTVKEDSLTRLLEKHWGKEIPKSPNLAHFMVNFAWEYYELNKNYEKVLKWTSKVLTIGNSAEEYDLFEAHKLRIFTFTETEDWFSLAKEADLLMKTFKEGQVTSQQLDLLIFIAGAHQNRGNELYDASENYEAKKAYEAAIPLYERWLEEAPEDHPFTEKVQTYLEYCIGRTK